MVKENWMGLSGVGPPKQDYVGVFNFPVRTGSTACSEYRRQTGDAGSVSSPVAAINVIRAHYRAHELLRCIVQFIRSLGATEHAEVPGIFFLKRPPEGRRNAVHGFIPGCGTMRTVFSH